MKIKTCLPFGRTGLKISPEMSNIGILVFGGDKPLIPLYMSRGTSKSAVQKGIKEAVKAGGRRKMDTALNAIANAFKTQSFRDGVGKLAILLTTGEDEGLDKPQFKDIGKELKAQGIKVVIVNMGKSLTNDILDEVGRDVIGDVKNLKSPNDLNSALDIVEKSAVDASRKFVFTLSKLFPLLNECNILAAADCP